MNDIAIEADIQAHLVTDTGHRFPVDLRLRYLRTAPYEIGVEVVGNGRTYCRAVLARELLALGMMQEAGRHAVRISPGAGPGETRLMLAREQREGADFVTPVVQTHALIRFLGQTYGMVPPGSEELDLDTDLAELLGSP